MLFFDAPSATLQFAGVPSSIVRVMQAIIVLCVVILNGMIRRLNVAWLNKPKPSSLRR